MGCPAFTVEKSATRRAAGEADFAPSVSATATPAPAAAERYHRSVSGMSTAAGTIQRVADQRATRALRSASFRKEAAKST